MRLKIKVGTIEIEAEGAEAEVRGSLDLWWSRLKQEKGQPTGAPIKDSPERTPSRRHRNGAVRPKDGTAEDIFSAVELANAIKEETDFSALEAAVLHKSDLFNKIALVCTRADRPLTSGQIAAVLTALDVKVHLGNLSVCIKQNGGKFLPSIARKAGGPPATYKLTSQAKANFLSWLSSESQT